MSARPDRDSYYDQDEAARRLVLALESQRRRRTGDLPRPITAARLARLAGIRQLGNRESQRKGVRVAVRRLREAGVPIAANGVGYFIAQTPDDHQAYRDFLRRHAIAELLTERAAARRPARREAAGQMVMFA